MTKSINAIWYLQFELPAILFKNVVMISTDGRKGGGNKRDREDNLLRYFAFTVCWRAAGRLIHHKSSGPFGKWECEIFHAKLAPRGWTWEEFSSIFAVHLQRMARITSKTIPLHSIWLHSDGLQRTRSNYETFCYHSTAPLQVAKNYNFNNNPACNQPVTSVSRCGSGGSQALL